MSKRMANACLTRTRNPKRVWLSAITSYSNLTYGNFNSFIRLFLIIINNCNSRVFLPNEMPNAPSKIGSRIRFDNGEYWPGCSWCMAFATYLAHISRLSRKPYQLDSLWRRWQLIPYFIVWFWNYIEQNVITFYLLFFWSFISEREPHEQINHNYQLIQTFSRNTVCNQCNPGHKYDETIMHIQNNKVIFFSQFLSFGRYFYSEQAKKSKNSAMIQEMKEK